MSVGRHIARLLIDCEAKDGVSSPEIGPPFGEPL